VRPLRWSVELKAPANCPLHEVAPKDWRKVPSFTGSHELDAVIQKNANGNLPARMKLYAHLGDEPGYGPRTAYNGYSGYSGDE
jgi:hypothetical protein